MLDPSSEKPGGAVAGAALAALFGAAGAQEFLAARWPERHYAVHRTPQQLPPVLRGPELASLDALAQRYRGAVTFGRGARDARTVSVDAHAANLFRLGLTVYLPDIAPFVAGAPAWLQALERELGLPAACCKLGAFASPRDDGVVCHFDADDVISIQLQGRKVFHVAPVEGLPYPAGRQFGPGMLPGDELYPQAGAGFPRPDGAPFERIAMAPGSVLFLPRGTWHRSEAGEDSFSVSIGIRPPAAMDRLLQRLRDLLLQDPQWRRPLYEAHGTGAQRDALAARLDGLIGDLPRLLDQIGGAALLQPATPQSVAPLTDASRLQKVPMARLDYARLDGRRLALTVTAWDQEWIERTTLATEAPAPAADLLDWLARTDAPFGAAAFYRHFPALPQRDKQQLLELLTRAGFLRLLWFPALAQKDDTGPS